LDGKDRRHKNIRADLWFCLFLLALLAVFFTATISYKPVTRRAPMVVMIPLAFMLVGQLCLIIRKIRRLKPKDPNTDLFPSIEKQKIHKSIQILVWLVLLLAMVYLVGHVGGIAVFLFLFLKFVSQENWKISLCVTTGVTIGIHVLFERVLMIPLSGGLIYETIKDWLWS